MVETASGITDAPSTPNAIDTPTPKAGPKLGDMQIAIAVAAGFLLGGFVGIRLARKFIVPPSLPRAAKPCTNCERKRAEEAASAVAALHAQGWPRLGDNIPAADSSVPDDEPEEMEFDQTQVEAPTRIFSPLGSSPS